MDHINNDDNNDNDTERLVSLSSSSSEIDLEGNAENDDEREEESQENEVTLSWYDKFKKLPLAGFILVLMACFVMTLAGVFVKVLVDIDPFVLTGYRNTIIFLLSAARLAYYRISPQPPGKTKYLVLRACFVATFSASLFYSFRHLPLGDARIITAAQPIFVTVCACLFIREPCGVFDVLALIVSLGGMTLVTQPPFIFGHSGSTIYDKEYFIGAAFALLGTVCQAIGFVITRSIKDVDFSVVTIWSGLFGSFPPILIAVALGTFSLPSTAHTPIVILIGVLSFMGQSLMTLALQVEDAGIVALVRKADDILVAYLIQVFYFHNIPNYLSIIGAVLITLTVFVTGGRKLLTNSTRFSILKQLCCLPVANQNESPS